MQRLQRVIAALIVFSAALASAQSWKSHGPFSGTVGAVAFDPSSPGSVYAGNRAGIFQSDDHGRTWRTSGCELGDTIVFSLAVAPRFVDPFPPVVVFAATAGGLYRSVDGAQTWSRLTQGLPDGGFSAVAVDLDGSHVYAASSSVYRSEDGGDSWREASTSFCSGGPDVLIQALLPLESAVLAATSCGVHRSTDGGDAWTLIQTGGAGQAVSLAGSATSSSVFASFFADSVVRSLDAGVGWSPVGSGLPSPPDLQTVLAADPAHAGVVYAGGWESGVFRSGDGGLHWTEANVGLENHRVLGLFVDPYSSLILAATGDRLYRSEDGAASWVLSDAGLRGISFASVATASGHVYAGAGERGDLLFPVVFHSSNAGQDWSAGATLPFPDPFQSVFPARDRPGLLFATSAQLARLARSEDGGDTWTPLDSALPPAVNGCGGGQGCAVNLAVASDGTLYAGSSDGQIFVSADRGDSWRALHPPVPAGLAAVDPRDPSRVYAESADADGSHLLLSEDGGTTWRTLGTTSYPIFSLVFDPAFRNVLYGINLFGRAVVRSVDGGASWETAGFAGPEGFLTLKVVAGADALYVPTDAGVYRSEDRGTTWAPFGDCLASPKVFDVAVDDRSGVLYAATNGGVFQIPVPAAGRGRVNPVPGVSAGPIRRTGSE